jgi:hypothetical protein
MAFAIATCGGESPPERPADAAPVGDTPVEIAHFPLDGSSLPAGRDATFDPGVSRDGNGSLRVESEQGGRLRLYELDDVGTVEGRLVYTGFLRSYELRGKAFLEMWCRPKEGDPVFVRGLPSSVAGTSDWTPQTIGFSDPDLCENPVSIELNVVIQGPGTVWIDDLRLWSVPED